MACIIVTFVTAAGLGYFLYSFCPENSEKWEFFRGLRGWGEGKEEDPEEKSSESSNHFLFNIAKIIFCQWDDRGLRSHSMVLP